MNYVRKYNLRDQSLKLLSLGLDLHPFTRLEILFFLDQIFDFSKYKKGFKSGFLLISFRFLILLTCNCWLVKDFEDVWMQNLSFSCYGALMLPLVCFSFTPIKIYNSIIENFQVICILVLRVYLKIEKDHSK